MVDTSAPPKPPHVIAKLKKQQVCKPSSRLYLATYIIVALMLMCGLYNFMQLEKERVEEIERDNQTLMCRMQKVMKTRAKVDHRKHHR